MVTADTATKAPPVSAPSYNWTGFYVGGHTGYGWDGDRRVSYTPNDPAANLFTCGGAAGGKCVPAATFGISGGLLGIEAGYNWQPTARWVVGVESDFSLTAISGSGTSNFLLAGGASTFQATENVDWFGTVRGRLGWLAADNFLLCGTGGLAYGHVKTSATLVSQVGNNGSAGAFTFACATAACFVGNTSQTLSGYAAGGGAAYAISPNVSLFAEYLYINLGHINGFNSVALFSGPHSPSSFAANFSDVIFNVVRIGLNYKF
jgi:outer membrane immunogenic protein